jgi:O-methyltransferase
MPMGGGVVMSAVDMSARNTLSRIAMQRRPEDLYLDLLKKALAFTLWPEPPVPIETFNYRAGPAVRWLVSNVAGLLRRKQLHLGRRRILTAEQREEGKIWPGYAHTMIGLKRLDNIQSCVEAVLREGVEGDLIETGVWRGGSCILMRAILAAYGVEDRKVYVADSFEGLPKPDPEKYPADKGDEHHAEVFLAVSQEDVENNFQKYGLLDDQVVFLKGWFKDTLPRAPIQKLSILRLDGDMYSSTMDSLGNLYPKLSSGGFCIIDDYALPGCKSAVDDFRRDQKISSELKTVDWTGRYWRKE